MVVVAPRPFDWGPVPVGPDLSTDGDLCGRGGSVAHGLSEPASEAN